MPPILKSNNPKLIQEIDQYHSLLLSEEGATARNYLASRNIFLPEINKFKIGYAKDGYFANRVVFPVFDISGEIKNITSRLIHKGKSPKSHLHLPGIKQDWFFNEIELSVPSKKLIIVESPIDCITLSSYGFNAVACMGANNVNKGKIHKLAQIDKIYICFDNDLNDAGDKAAKRVGELVYSVLNKKAKQIVIPFLLGPDVNAMAVNNPADFHKSFSYLIQMATTIVPKEKTRQYRHSIEKTKYKFDIVKLAQQYVELTPCKSGMYKAICPIHEETEPSFYVNENTNRWICFGHGEGGDAIDLLRAIERSRGKHLGFKEAVTILNKI